MSKESRKLRYPNLILLFSHKLTENQIKSAKTEMNINKFIYLEPELQKLWSNIPPEIENIKDYLSPIYQFLKENTEKGDYVLIHGDFGAVYLMVNYAFELGLIPIYSTTGRITREKKMNENTIKLEHFFRHKRFRKYE